MHAAFTAAGGQAALRLLPAYGEDGHNLYDADGGSAVWGPPVEAFLKAQNALR
jgi:hypothetical protein